MGSDREHEETLQAYAAALSKAEGRAEALELDSARSHQLLDEISVPREVSGAPGERVIELSLSGRLELLLDELENE